MAKHTLPVVVIFSRRWVQQFIFHLYTCSSNDVVSFLSMMLFVFLLRPWVKTKDLCRTIQHDTLALLSLLSLVFLVHCFSLVRPLLHQPKGRLRPMLGCHQTLVSLRNLLFKSFSIYHEFQGQGGPQQQWHLGSFPQNHHL